MLPLTEPNKTDLISPLAGNYRRIVIGDNGFGGKIQNLEFGWSLENTKLSSKTVCGQEYKTINQNINIIKVREPFGSIGDYFNKVLTLIWLEKYTKLDLIELSYPSKVVKHVSICIKGILLNMHHCTSTCTCINMLFRYFQKIYG